MSDPWPLGVATGQADVVATGQGAVLGGEGGAWAGLVIGDPTPRHGGRPGFGFCNHFLLTTAPRGGHRPRSAFTKAVKRPIRGLTGKGTELGQEHVMAPSQLCSRAARS